MDLSPALEQAQQKAWAVCVQNYAQRMSARVQQVVKMAGLRASKARQSDMQHDGKHEPAEKNAEEVAPNESVEASNNMPRCLQYVSGGHTRREWLLLGERVFSHPRYALLIVAALVLCMFERYWFVLAPLGLFFVVEWALRFWLQRENRFRNRTELMFLVLDGLATLSLMYSLLVPDGVLSQGLYLRIARLLRGMYMLRMLRVFSFLTWDTFIYSLPFALTVMGMVGLALAVDSIALYMGVLLMMEALCRGYAVFRILPDGGRKRAELGFAVLDGVSSVALLGVWPGVAAYWAALRVLRFLVMLNPLGNISLAAGRVLSMQEVRSESGMLAGMMVAMMIMGGLSVVYLYPQMDINDDGDINAADYVPVQVVLYVFRLMVDPGAATPEAFSPWLVALTAFLVLSGVFFFALVVSLGSNVMHYMLKELSNSPLSAREHLLIAGWNDQAHAILKRLGGMFGRMRQSFASVWIFHGDAAEGADTVGTWLSVREVETGSRNLSEHFRLSGVQQMILFRQKQDEHLVDTHHLVRDFGVPGVLVSEVTLPDKLQRMYTDSMGMRVLDSSSVTARMLYQMHHCAWMPELGIRLLDAVAGETGLYTHAWTFDVEVGQGMPLIRAQQHTQHLSQWLAACFAEGVNLLAGRREDGSFVLFSDLAQGKAQGHFVDVVGMGSNTLLWNSVLESALNHDMKYAPTHALKQFVWPETWDLSMMFMGWHPGLPAMIEEMALKHHKLTVHVLSTQDADTLADQLRQLKSASERAAAQCSCELKVSVHAWDGLDAEVWQGLLRGCKVMMFYPEAQPDASEDSLLELWFHEVARLLSERKQEVKWWTPPKLMVLTRDADHIHDFEMAALDYPVLEVEVGSPDAFHDTFMARQLLTQARRTLYPEDSLQDDKSYAFMDAMLGDAVLVEDVETTRLVEVSAGMDWLPIYREAMSRGWMLMAYVMPEVDKDGQTLFGLLDQAFPQPQDESGSRLHLLAGSPVMEMDVPLQTVALLFCRRGVLDVHDEGDKLEDAAESEVVQEADVLEQAKVEEGQQASSVEEDKAPETAVAVQDEVKEGVVMNDSVWPQTADKRLLTVLKKQVQGSLELLAESSEDGLIKLTEVLDMGVSEEVEEAIMAALTDLQNIDRVSQRLTNVQTCLDDWAKHVPEAGQSALWEEEVAKRYVMEEERMVLKGEL